MKKTALLLLMFVLCTGGFAHAQDEAACDAGFHAFEDAFGTVCVPENAERVVALEWTYIESLLALGIQPVGAADIENYHVWVTIPLELDESVTEVGTRQEPNLELIAQLDPDLILTASFRATENYDELSAIAPTLAFDHYPTDDSSHFQNMLDTFGTIAEAVNREDTAQAVLTTMENYFASAHSALETAGRANETFILSQGWVANDAATFRLFTDNAMAVQILEQIGLENAWDDAPQLYGFTEVSFEGFAGIEDTNFFYIAQGDANEAFADSPLWNGLPFVQAGHDYWLGGDVWLFGGPLSAELLVDTILDAMGVEIPETSTASAFPVTIEHQYGSTTIEQVPERIVSIGYTDQDALLALGVIPVAVRYWYGDETNAVFPWAEDEANGAIPEVLNMAYGNLNYEALLALQPDLIIAVNSGITQDEYDTLTQIAPTLAQSGDYINFGMPWQEITRMIGAAVGKSAEAEALIALVDGLFEEARAENPEFEGQTLAVAYNYGEGRTYGYYTPQDARGRFFTQLGFVIPQELIDIAGDQFYADLSTERIDLLDQDLLVFLGLQFAEGGQDAIINDPLISQLDVVRDGHVVFVPSEYDDALQFSTVLSLEYALEGILPEIEAVIGE